MNNSHLDSDLSAIAKLGAWQKAARYNWIVESQTCAELIIAHVEFQADNPALGRLMLFPGFDAYRDYSILRHSPDAGLAISPLDVLHWEFVAIPGEGYGLHSFRPGYAPQPVESEEERALLAPIVHECRGVMMRLDEDPELGACFAKDNSLFARREGLDGKWRDAPYPAPKERAVLREERIALNRDECAAAGHLPIIPDEVWEVDFICVPVCITDEKRPRLMYLFAGIEGKGLQRRIWQRMSVEPNSPNGLQKLWESLAGRLLKAFIGASHVPGTISVRSSRMARFLRPLGLQVPFKLVQHGKLPMLEKALENAAKERTF